MLPDHGRCFHRAAAQPGEGAWRPGAWSLPARDSACARCRHWHRGPVFARRHREYLYGSGAGRWRWLVCSRISVGIPFARAEGGRKHLKRSGGREQNGKKGGQPPLGVSLPSRSACPRPPLQWGVGELLSRGWGRPRGGGFVKCHRSQSPPSRAGPRPAPSPKTSPRPHPVGPTKVPRA